MTEEDTCNIFQLAEPGLELRDPVALHCLIESYSLSSFCNHLFRGNPTGNVDTELIEVPLEDS